MFCHPSGGFEYRGHLQYPAFDLNSLFFKECFIYFWQCWVFFVASYKLSLVAVSWGGYYLVEMCRIPQLLLVPCSFFVFCCWRRGVSRCKPCRAAAKCPKCQPVSLLLLLLLSLLLWQHQLIPWVTRCPLLAFKSSQSHLVHVCAKSLQSCLTLCDPVDCNPPGSCVHGIF